MFHFLVSPIFGLMASPPVRRLSSLRPPYLFNPCRRAVRLPAHAGVGATRSRATFNITFAEHGGISGGPCAQAVLDLARIRAAPRVLFGGMKKCTESVLTRPLGVQKSSGLSRPAPLLRPLLLRSDHYSP